MYLAHTKEEQIQYKQLWETKTDFMHFTHRYSRTWETRHPTVSLLYWSGQTWTDIYTRLQSYPERPDHAQLSQPHNRKWWLIIPVAVSLAS